MNNLLKRVLKANFAAGMLPALVAPLIWPLVVFASEGTTLSWETYPKAALTIFVFSLFFGLTGCLILGIPSLLVLERLNVNTPAMAACVGCVLLLATFSFVGADRVRAPIGDIWPVCAFLGTLGAVCGGAASYLTRSDKVV